MRQPLDNEELINDIDYIYNSYKVMLSEGKSSLNQLNTLIRALKEAHKYFNYGKNNQEESKKD